LDGSNDSNFGGLRRLPLPVWIAVAPQIADCLQSGASRLSRPLGRGTVLPSASLYRPVRTGPARITGFDDTGMTVLAFVKKFHNSPIFDTPYNEAYPCLRGRGRHADGLRENEKRDGSRHATETIRR